MYWTIKGSTRSDPKAPLWLLPLTIVRVGGAAAAME